LTGKFFKSTHTFTLFFLNKCSGNWESGVQEVHNLHDTYNQFPFEVFFEEDFRTIKQQHVPEKVIAFM